MHPPSDTRRLNRCSTTCTPFEVPLHGKITDGDEEAIRLYRIELSSPDSPVGRAKGENEFDVYALNTSELPAALVADPLKSGLLQDEEITALRRYRFLSDRERVFASIILRRCVLSLYDSRPPAAWRFVRGSRGKPEIAPGSIDRHGPRLVFSVSRSNVVSVCAVSRSGSVGVDIESTDAQLDPGLSSAVLHPAEVAESGVYIPSMLQPYELLRYWTLKEALLKATGEGLWCDLTEIAFTGVGTSEIRLATPVAGATTQWQFTNHKIFDTYVMSTAYAVSGSS